MPWISKNIRLNFETGAETSKKFTVKYILYVQGAL